MPLAWGSTMITISLSSNFGDIPKLPEITAIVKRREGTFKVLGFDWHDYRVLIEGLDAVEWVPMSTVKIESQAPKELPFRRGSLCNVGNCGNGHCVHEWVGLYCPHCHYEMIIVTRTGYMFCSQPNSHDSCDYGGDCVDVRPSLIKRPE